MMQWIMDAIIASALDIVADEVHLKNDMGEVLSIKSQMKIYKKYYIIYFMMY